MVREFVLLRGFVQLPQAERHAVDAVFVERQVSVGIADQVEIAVMEHGAGDRDRLGRLVDGEANAGRTVANALAVDWAVVGREIEPFAGEQVVVSVAKFADAVSVFEIGGAELGDERRVLELDARCDRIEPFDYGVFIEIDDLIDVDGKNELLAGVETSEVDYEQRRAVDHTEVEAANALARRAP